MPFFRGADFSFELNKRTYIMGILNVTSDSFFDGGRWNSIDKAVLHAMKMQEEGADIIDIGAQSTRPGSISLSADEELNIIKEYISVITDSVRIPVSVDTFYPSVAEYCLSNGASIINDVSGVINSEMAEVVASHNAGWVVMHTGGCNSGEVADYSLQGGVVKSVQTFFDYAENTASEYGINHETLCFDMGIGFGKSNEDNIELLRNINRLKTQDRALLTALSCKRVVANTTGADGEDRLFGTIAADVIATAGKTDFIRVHHVKQAVLSSKMADALVR